MEERFEAHLDREFPELLTAPLILACSGGVDSVVLARLCHGAGLDFALAHADFGLRSTESDADKESVETLSTTLGVPCHTERFDVEGHRSRVGGSLQMAARQLRYEWFEALCVAEGYRYVLTAHHLDDCLETFLINLSRGTGIEGLSGIPARNGRIRRPLLPFSKEELVGLARSRDWPWREDSSNTSPNYLRNRVRHLVVPELKALHPRFSANFAKTLTHLAASRDTVREKAEAVRALLWRRDGDRFEIPVEGLDAHRGDSDMLHALFKPYGWDDPTPIRNLLEAGSGKRLESRTHILLKDRGRLLLKERGGVEPDRGHHLIPHAEAFLQAPVKLRCAPVDAIGETGMDTLYADQDQLSFPLRLRKWRKGDQFHPHGMKGRKKVSKFLKDLRMDRFAKDEQWVLCSGEDILWVVGQRADDRFRVKPETRNILKIVYER